MNRTLLKILSLLAAACLLAGLSGCELAPREDVSESERIAVEDAEGQTTAEVIQDTYKADHIFSLNRVAGDTFNPHTATTVWNRVVGMLVYETLVSADSSFEAGPNLITNWSSEDGRLWTFTVDTGRSFHDGGVMTAYDAVYSLECARNEYTGRYIRRFSHVTDISVVDSATFTVTLDAPNWLFYQLLNIPCIETGSIYSERPPGTGPYKFNSSGTRLVLDPNHPLYDQMPLKTIYLKSYTAAEDVLQAFEDSLLDLVVNNPSDMSSLGYSRSNLIKYVETSNLHFIGYNMQSRIFSYAPYRQMITYAIDRDTIVSNAMQGSGAAATLPIHPNSRLYPGAVARTLEYSPESLQAVAANLGAEDADLDGVVEFGGQPAEITFLVCTDSGAKVSAARMIAAQLRSVGFSVTMSEQSYDDYITALQNGEYDMYYAEVKLCDDWDLSQLLTPGGELNYTGFQDATLTSYIQAFLGGDVTTAEDPAAAQAANAEALYSYIAQSAPITAVCFERIQVLYHRGVLTTINPTQDNYFNDMQDWNVNLD